MLDNPFCVYKLHVLKNVFKKHIYTTHGQKINVVLALQMPQAKKKYTYYSIIHVYAVILSNIHKWVC